MNKEPYRKAKEILRYKFSSAMDASILNHDVDAIVKCFVDAISDEHGENPSPQDIIESIRYQFNIEDEDEDV